MNTNNQEGREDVEELIKLYLDNRMKFKSFSNAIVGYLEDHPESSSIHSIKQRLKDVDHLRAKLIRKIDGGRSIGTENFFSSITDLSGVRIIHLYPKQIRDIHQIIQSQIDEKEWVLHEEPKAYSWDPGLTHIFTELGIKVETKESYYTSVHYVIRPNPTSPVRCEIQTRTLMEEAWGEIDHQINYPKEAKSPAVKEMLKSLARLVVAGTTLSQAIIDLNCAED